MQGDERLEDEVVLSTSLSTVFIVEVCASLLRRDHYRLVQA